MFSSFPICLTLHAQLKCKFDCIFNQVRVRSTLQNNSVLFLVRNRRKNIPNSLFSPMLGKPGTDVAWLIEDWFVRLILGLHRWGNKKLLYTTRGLYQNSYHSLGKGTKAVISVWCREALGHHWSEGNFQQIAHGVSGMDMVWLSNWCCTCALCVDALPFSEKSNNYQWAGCFFPPCMEYLIVVGNMPLVTEKLLSPER